MFICFTQRQQRSKASCGENANEQMNVYFHMFVVTDFAGRCVGYTGECCFFLSFSCREEILYFPCKHRDFLLRNSECF
jgi:hypothetical protein